jgi:hypothetical protein
MPFPGRAGFVALDQLQTVDVERVVKALPLDDGSAVSVLASAASSVSAVDEVGGRD